MKGGNADPPSPMSVFVLLRENVRERNIAIWMFNSSDHCALGICVPGKCCLQVSFPKHTAILYVKGTSPQEPIHPGAAISAGNFAST